MSTDVITSQLEIASLADVALKAAVRSWFAVAIAGQLMFVYYIVVVYGGSAIGGDFQSWNRILAHGWVSGQTIGNGVLAAHLFFAAAIIICGSLLLIPAVRTRFPSVHRWTGRVYVPIAFIMAVSALYLVLSGRKVSIDLTQRIAVSINALLIMVCAAMAGRYAIARDFRTHRRWAMRLFLVVSGQWFVRVGFMFWVVVNGASERFDPRTFQGPMLSFLSFAQYLLPLAIFELYLRAQRSAAPARLAFAISLFVLTLAMGVGIIAATMRMWLPHI
jgi:hypothetical protein